jgi:hypothetical protein
VELGVGAAEGVVLRRAVFELPADRAILLIRGLLLDTHYADNLGNGRVRTYLPNREALDLIKDQDGVSDQSFAAALRIRERIGFRGKGTRGTYLCHTLCELGATALSTGLRDVHDFLVTHPSDVVVIVNQDYITRATPSTPSPVPG